MPRKKYIPSFEYPYHVWARSNNREWFQLPMQQTWEIFSNQLYCIRHTHNLRIHSFVLMNNHYHMIVSTPEANLAEAMNRFQTSVSLEIGRASDRINRIFGAPYGWSLICSNYYFHNAYKYLYRNPVEAGLCKVVEAYPYSTLHGLLGQRHLRIPLQADEILFSDLDGSLKWLNEAYPNKAVRDAIGRGMRRTEFKLPKKMPVLPTPGGGPHFQGWGPPPGVGGA